MKKPISDPTEADRVGAEILARRKEKDKERKKESWLETLEQLPYLMAALGIAALTFMGSRFSAIPSIDFYAFLIPYFLYLLWFTQHQLKKAEQKIDDLSKRLARLEKDSCDDEDV